MQIGTHWQPLIWETSGWKSKGILSCLVVLRCESRLAIITSLLSPSPSKYAVISMSLRIMPVCLVSVFHGLPQPKQTSSWCSILYDSFNFPLLYICTFISQRKEDWKSLRWKNPHCVRRMDFASPTHNKDNISRQAAKKKSMRHSNL